MNERMREQRDWEEAERQKDKRYWQDKNTNHMKSKLYMD